MGMIKIADTQTEEHFNDMMMMGVPWERAHSVVQRNRAEGW
jgi:hypothetical protein